MTYDISVFSVKSSSKPDKINLVINLTSLDDASLQLPQGLYSTFRTWGGCKKVLGLNVHLDRLYLPAAQRDIHPSASEGELRDALRTLLVPYKSGEARVRVSLSLSENPGQIYVILENLKLLDDVVYEKGIKVVTSLESRTNPRLKATNFIQKSAGERQKIQKEGVTEALMVKNNRILEGLTSNFFAVIDGKIITANNGILLGVTRKFVLRVARLAGIEIKYRPLLIHELETIKEAFITSSSRGVVPVVAVNDLAVGNGKPGEISKKLRYAFDFYILDKAEEI